MITHLKYFTVGSAIVGSVFGVIYLVTNNLTREHIVMFCLLAVAYFIGWCYYNR